MKLIAILICLGIITYTPLVNKCTSPCCFRGYADFFKNKLNLSNQWALAAVLVLPPLIVFVLLYCWLAPMFYNLAGLAIATVVLWLCLGKFQTLPSDVDGDHTTQTVKDLFTQNHNSIFAVLIWFVLLGPFGALLYRCISGFNAANCTTPQKTEDDDTETATESTCSGFSCLQGVMDWIPVRLTVLIFALSGDFTKAFNYWLERALHGTSSNRELLENGSLIAINMSPDTEEAISVEQLESVQGQLKRSLVLLLVLVALFTIGRWIL